MTLGKTMKKLERSVSKGPISAGILKRVISSHLLSTFDFQVETPLFIPKLRVDAIKG